MLEDFKHSVGDFFKSQSEELLHKQLSISQAVFNERTGRLNQLLAGPAHVNESEMSVTIPYPLYIRFLDMKQSATKTQTVNKTILRNGKKLLKRVRRGKTKQNYVPIYNKYVYGYLKSATYRRLKLSIPAFMIKEFTHKI